MTSSDNEVKKARLPYAHQEIEGRWQARWDADATYEVDTAAASLDGDGLVRFYNLVEFPYPSGEGLHVGHAMTYCGADVVGRYQRVCGKRVFQPIAFDAFGINAENYALREGVHPAPLMEQTMAYFRDSQLSRLGCAWNWREAVTTCDPGYYRWTQWLFLRLLEAGLAYRATAPVTWCPSCQTVLAHEQLEGGSCERCGTGVVEREMSQWFLRITAYADALVDGLERLDWPERAKRIQREWIGRSRGVEIDFGDLTVFTTRPETVMGVRFLAVAIDHPLVAAHPGGDVTNYVEAARQRAASGEPSTAKTAVPLGIDRPHPLTGQPVAVFVADYVLAGYGTGAVMGVPAHDERDRALAAAIGIDPRAAPLIDPQGIGRPATRYRLRDWLISRQRYWGPPIPVVHCPLCGAVPVPDWQLPCCCPRLVPRRFASPARAARRSP